MATERRESMESRDGRETLYRNDRRAGLFGDGMNWKYYITDRDTMFIESMRTLWRISDDEYYLEFYHNAAKSWIRADNSTHFRFLKSKNKIEATEEDAFLEMV